MEYAFYNLLTNAIKYSPPRTQVTLAAVRKHEHACISVEDQGIGMDQKEVKQIFQKFYRTKRAEESGEAGTGIGLSIVEQIVKQHGGTIEVTSQPGHGSCFTMVLPAPGSRRAGERKLMSRLLVVEDDPAVRTTVVTFLELEGYSVDAVASTGEALERLDRTKLPHRDLRYLHRRAHRPGRAGRGAQQRPAVLGDPDDRRAAPWKR